MTKDKHGRKLPVLKFIFLFIMIAIIVLSVLFAFNNEALSSIDWEIFNPQGLFDELLSEKKANQSISVRLDNLNVKASGTYMGNL
ncbi:MAG: hypothetical protein GX045_06525 [Clostridiaceae bacterium]|nr:hypothetical protein [Clostridiaceae bacterium]